MVITSTPLDILRGGEIDSTSVGAIHDSEEFWKENTVTIEPMSKAVVILHPHLVAENDSPYKGAFMASGPYENTMAPRDQVIVHYQGDFKVFPEPVLMSPESLAGLLKVEVSDLPNTNLVSNKETGMIDVVRFSTKGNQLATDHLGVLDLDKGDNILIISDLNIATDNYHKNYHLIKDTFGIDISDINNFSGVYIEQDQCGEWQAVQYEVDGSDLSADERKRRRVSELDSSLVKPEEKRSKIEEKSVPQDPNLEDPNLEKRKNDYTKMQEVINKTTMNRNVLYTFANEDDAKQTHQKFMQIAYAYEEPEERAPQ